MQGKGRGFAALFVGQRGAAAGCVAILTPVAAKSIEEADLAVAKRSRCSICCIPAEGITATRCSGTLDYLSQGVSYEDRQVCRRLVRGRRPRRGADRGSGCADARAVASY